jgi:hypothetical protein
MEYLVVWADAMSTEKRSWIKEKDFIDFSQFKDDVDMIMAWRASGVSKRDFMMSSPEASRWLRRKRSIGDDSKNGWCAYNSVGLALELVGSRNPITPTMIRSFVEAGAKRRCVEGFFGVRWPALKAFVAKLQTHGVNIDMEVFSDNLRKQGEVGVQGLAGMGLENGVYVLGGLPKHHSKYGHSVVLDIQEDRVDVYDDDELLDIEDLSWLHQMSYIARVKIKSE